MLDEIFTVRHCQDRVEKVREQLTKVDGNDGR